MGLIFTATIAQALFYHLAYLHAYNIDYVNDIVKYYFYIELYLMYSTGHVYWTTFFYNTSNAELKDIRCI
jgi:hypothetical protein